MEKGPNLWPWQRTVVLTIPPDTAISTNDVGIEELSSHLGAENMEEAYTQS